ETARVIDDEVNRILREQEERCRQLLREHHHALDLVARALLERETNDGSEVTRLLAMAAERQRAGAGAGTGSHAGRPATARPDAPSSTATGAERPDAEAGAGGEPRDAVPDEALSRSPRQAPPPPPT